MKSIRKLKTERYSNICRMTNEEAELAYKTGYSKDSDAVLSDMPSRVNCGFFVMALTFEEWLFRYHVVII